MAAAQFRLQGLVGIVDRNRLCIDGDTEEIIGVEPLHERFASFGWAVQRIDGHDLDQILSALDGLAPAGDGKPQMIIADTVKRRGARMMEGNLNWHVGNLVGRDYDGARGDRGLRARGRG